MGKGIPVKVAQVAIGTGLDEPHWDRLYPFALKSEPSFDCTPGNQGPYTVNFALSLKGAVYLGQEPGGEDKGINPANGRLRVVGLPGRTG
jgi:hypothetical protein